MDAIIRDEVTHIVINSRKKEKEQHIVNMLKVYYNVIIMLTMLPTDLIPSTEPVVKQNISTIVSRTKKDYLSTLAMDQYRMISHIYKPKEYMLENTGCK